MPGFWPADPRRKEEASMTPREEAILDCLERFADSVAEYHRLLNKWNHSCLSCDGLDCDIAKGHSLACQKTLFIQLGRDVTGAPIRARVHDDAE